MKIPKPFKIRLLWFIIGFLVGCALFMSFPFWLWGADSNEGVLWLEPTYSLQHGQGMNSQFNVSQRIIGKWWLAPQLQYSNVRDFQDASGRLDFEYHLNEKWTLEAGEGYDRYYYYGDRVTLSHDGHAGVKMKLW